MLSGWSHWSQRRRQLTPYVRFVRPEVNSKSDLHVLRLGALKALKRVFFLFSDPTAKSQSANLVARQLMCEKHGRMCDVN